MGIDRPLNHFLNVSRSGLWQLFAATLIGAFVGVVVLLKSRSSDHWAMSVLGGAALGFFAGSILLGADAYRRRTGGDKISLPAAVGLGCGFFALVILILVLAVKIFAG
jgi:hypothetical protein